MDKILICSIVMLCIMVVFCLIRAVLGPKTSDRLIAINVICTKTMVIISIISFILREAYFVDVAMVYALIGFIATIVISKYVEVKANASK